MAATPPYPQHQLPPLHDLDALSFNPNVSGVSTGPEVSSQSTAINTPLLGKSPAPPIDMTTSARKGPMPTSYRPPPPEADNSFLRMSMSTAAPSDWAPSSTWSFHSPPLPPMPAGPALSEAPFQKDAGTDGKKRASQDTFGIKSRRWSPIGSASSDSGHGFLPMTSPPIPTPDSKLTPGRPRQRHRALSMSSASESTEHTAPSAGWDPPAVHRATHKRSETDEAITAHLLDQSAHNKVRIVPRAKSTSPPTNGTPFSTGKGQENDQDRESEASEDRQMEAARRAKARMSKLEQVLGEGAETARVSLMKEKEAMEYLLEKRGPLSAPLVPLMAHQQSRFNTADCVTAPVSPTCSPLVDHSLKDTHLRSNSLDSLSSFQPSIAESKRPLLPQPFNPVTRPSQRQSKHKEPAFLDLAVRNDLSADQRAALLKRARKLEQVLGEPLQSQDIQKHVVDASTAGRSYLTKVSTNDFPSPPASALPSWHARDCEPHVRPAESKPGLARSGSKLARRAKAALGLQAVAEVGDYHVYVERETMVQEAKTGGFGAGGFVVDAGSPDSPLFRDDAVDEVTLRTSRHQISKLHRLLGVPIPSHLLDATHVRERSPPSAIAMARSPSDPKQTGSYMIFGDEVKESEGANWQERIRSATLGRKRSASVPYIEDDMSFMSLDDHSAARLTSQEKAVFRKRAQKLGQVFGEKPPATSFLPLTNGSTAPHRKEVADLVGPSSFDAYQRSIEGLLYLAEHDQARLGSLVDALNEPSDEIAADAVPSPTWTQPRYDPTSPPVIDPQSHSARRRRTGKLSQFFGEAGVDFTDPDALQTRLDQNSTGRGRGKARREVLDGVLGEIWRGVQTEIRLGRIKHGEGEKLGELMGLLRRRREALKGWQEL